MPYITPSGLSIGIILNTKYFLSSFASFHSESIKSRKPCITWELLDSPGCTLADIITAFLWPCINVKRLKSLKFKPIVYSRSYRDVNLLCDYYYFCFYPIFIWDYLIFLTPDITEDDLGRELWNIWGLNAESFVFGRILKVSNYWDSVLANMLIFF